MLNEIGNFLSSMMEMAKQVSSNIKCDPLAVIKDIGLGILYSMFENILMPFLNLRADIKDFFSFNGSKVTRWWNNLEQAILDFGIADEMNFYAGQLIGDIVQIGISLYNLLSLFKNLPSILKNVKDLLPQLLTTTAVGVGAVAGKTGSAPLQLSKAFGINVDVAAELVSALGISGAAVALGIAGATGLTNDIGKIMEMAGNKGGSNTGGEFKPLEITTNKEGELTNGAYTLNEGDIQLHLDGTPGNP